MMEAVDVTEEHVWKVLDKYFQENGLVKQQVDSFNQFTLDIGEVIREYGKFSFKIKDQYELEKSRCSEREFEFQFEDQLYKLSSINHINSDKKNEEVDPMTCRLRDLNYETTIKLMLKYRNTDETQWKSFDKLKVAVLPIMVQSKWCKLSNKTQEERIEFNECPYDQGGYFIIKGSEKVVVAQERMAFNFVYTFKTKEPNSPWVTEIRSVKKGIASLPAIFKILVKLDPKGRPKIFCRIKTVSKDIPLAIVLRALGIVTDLEIFETICYKITNLDEDELKEIKGILEIIRYSIEDITLTQKDECQRYIGDYLEKLKGEEKQHERYALETVERTLREKLLPHIGTDNSSLRRKAFFIGYMVNKLLYAYLGKTEEDDRDHYGKKRLDMTGTLMISLFKDQFKNTYVENGKKLLRKMISEGKNLDTDHRIQKIFDESSITNTMRNALATGNWGKSATGEVVRSGVAQVLKRDTSFFATLSHLRRVVAPIQASSKSAKPRLLHNTHFGMICPSETPEGQKIGIVKNFALMAKVTIGGEKLNDELKDLIKDMNYEEFDDNANLEELKSRTKVMLNGNWIGFTDEPQKIVRSLKAARTKGLIPDEVSVVRDIVQKEIKIYTDSGRCMRPLFIVKNNQLILKPHHIDRNLSFNELKREGVVEYVDVEEEESCLVATDLSYLENS